MQTKAKPYLTYPAPARPVPVILLLSLVAYPVREFVTLQSIQDESNEVLTLIHTDQSPARPCPARPCPARPGPARPGQSREHYTIFIILSLYADIYIHRFFLFKHCGYMV
jgi:hypothetical protein